MECRSFLLSLFLVITARRVQGGKDSSSFLLSEGDQQCPPWFFYNNTSKQCECYSNPSTDDIVKCTEHGVLLQFGYCMTYEEDTGFYVGPCYNYFDIKKYDFSAENSHIKLPSNVSNLNDYMCSPLHRNGIMCSQCIDGYGPSVTSVVYTCNKCSELYWLSLIGYLFLEFVLITIFYLIVLILRLNLTSAPMVAFVLYCQFQGFLFSVMSNRYIIDPNISLFWKILMIFYGIFNLDFCRYIIPAFCVSPNLEPFHITFLSYIPFLYLLCLIITTWICIKLHSKSTKSTIWLWRRLNHFLFTHINDTKNSMIDVFATFFLLLYAKLMFISIDTALRPSVIWNAKNSLVYQSRCLFSDPNIKFSSVKYLPFIIFSSIVTSLVLLLPILLALYPIRAFRSLFFKSRIIRHHMGAINMLLDKFYSCYKDGLDGGRDMRSFVSLYYFIYWLIFALCVVEELFSPMHLSLGAIVFTVFGFLVAVVRPYKKTYMNVSDTLILANLALFYILLEESVNYYYLSSLYWIILSILNSIPILVLTIVIIYAIFRKIKKSSYWQKSMTESTDVEKLQQSSLDCDDPPEVPDRMLHPDRYDPENNYGSTERSLLHSESQKLDVYCSV